MNNEPIAETFKTALKRGLSGESRNPEILHRTDSCSHKSGEFERIRGCLQICLLKEKG